jgi:hypothetical protein
MMLNAIPMLGSIGSGFRIQSRIDYSWQSSRNAAAEGTLPTYNSHRPTASAAKPERLPSDGFIERAHSAHISTRFDLARVR